MELLQMQYFNAIVDNGSMTAAAESLHVSQPTLSCSIKKLEDELGTRLLCKQGRYLVCTEAGKHFHEKSQKILLQIDNLIDETKTFNHSVRQTIRVVSNVIDISSESTLLLQNSNVSYIVEVTRNNMTIGSHNFFLSGKADFLITSEPLTKPGVSGQLLFTDPLVILVSSSHPLAKFSEISVSELSNEQFITLSKGTPTRLLHEQALELAGVTKPKFRVVNEPETIPILVSRNQGIAFIPQSVFNMATVPNNGFQMKNVSGIKIKDVSVSKKIFLYWKTNEEDNEIFKLYRSFMQWFCEYISEHGVIPISMEH